MLQMPRLWECPLRWQAAEASGSGGSGSSYTVMGEVLEDPSNHCRKLQKE